ncbi:MAG: hypothetical protein JJU23_02715 [Cyclobacteriaceae bacterium]|nr:hypothetical protein [Cyclobacteriaceae bacterium]
MNGQSGEIEIKERQIQVNEQSDKFKIQETLNHLEILNKTVKLVHWNAEGPTAYVLHELTDEFIEEIDGHTDLIAEQFRVLGHYPEIDLAQLNEMKDDFYFPNEKIKVEDAIQQLIENYELVITTLDAKIEKAEADLVTQDYFIDLKTDLLLQQWKLKMQL